MSTVREQGAEDAVRRLSFFQLLTSDSGLSRCASGVGLKMMLPALSYGTLSGVSASASL